MTTRRPRFDRQRARPDRGPGAPCDRANPHAPLCSGAGPHAGLDPEAAGREIARFGAAGFGFGLRRVRDGIGFGLRRVRDGIGFGLRRVRDGVRVYAP